MRLWAAFPSPLLSNVLAQATLFTSMPSAVPSRRRSCMPLSPPPDTTLLSCQSTTLCSTSQAASSSVAHPAEDILQGQNLCQVGAQPDVPSHSESPELGDWATCNLRTAGLSGCHTLWLAGSTLGLPTLHPTWSGPAINTDTWDDVWQPLQHVTVTVFNKTSGRP
eukprot:63714-Rhodomonas_salina.1